MADMIDFAVELKVVTQGVGDASMAHIHTSPAGENGRILVGLEQAMNNANIWMSWPGLAIGAAILQYSPRVDITQMFTLRLILMVRFEAKLSN